MPACLFELTLPVLIGLLIDAVRIRYTSADKDQAKDDFNKKLTLYMIIAFGTMLLSALFTWVRSTIAQSVA